MAISFTKYVNITSGVGGGATVATRELIARLFTTNPYVPVNTYIEFDSAEEVGEYFGTTSTEYARAAFYFAYVSKNITSPQKISFARWVDVATAPYIIGKAASVTLASLQAITDGSFTLTLGSNTNEISGLDFSAAASLTTAASLIEDAIQLETGAMWTSATVVFNSSRSCFDFTGGLAEDAVLTVAPGTTGTDISTLIGWMPQSVDGNPLGAIWSDGQTVETVTDTLTKSAAASDNFGSFLFMPTLTIDEIIEAAEWNVLENVKFQYSVPVTAANYASYSAALLTYGGTELTLVNSETGGLYHEMMPMAFLAATRYDQRNSTINYMFNQYTGATATVTDTTTSNTYDTARVNYYGQTQTAGRKIEFYQRGLMCGISTDPTDMNTYANEQWLKDAAGAAIMTLLLALPKVSANAQGSAQLVTTLQSVIDQALINGVISVQGVLSSAQKLYIGNITGDPKAWYQVQNSGYWVDCVIEAYTNASNAVEYKAVYTLVYKKDDVIRSVEGRHVLI